MLSGESFTKCLLWGSVRLLAGALKTYQLVKLFSFLLSLRYPLPLPAASVKYSSRLSCWLSLSKKTWQHILWPSIVCSFFVSYVDILNPILSFQLLTYKKWQKNELNQDFYRGYCLAMPNVFSFLLWSFKSETCFKSNSLREAVCLLRNFYPCRLIQCTTCGSTQV